MQGFDDTPVRTFGPLVRSECIHLLETHSLGRLAWQAADSQQVRPINYVFRSGALYFRTSPEGILSELVRPTDVALEVDDLDHDKRTGWSVIVNGRARAVAAPAEVIRAVGDGRSRAVGTGYPRLVHPDHAEPDQRTPAPTSAVRRLTGILLTCGHAGRGTLVAAHRAD